MIRPNKIQQAFEIPSGLEERGRVAIMTGRPDPGTIRALRDGHGHIGQDCAFPDRFRVVHKPPDGLGEAAADCSSDVRHDTELGAYGMVGALSSDG